MIEDILRIPFSGMLSSLYIVHVQRDDQRGPQVGGLRPSVHHESFVQKERHPKVHHLCDAAHHQVPIPHRSAHRNVQGTARRVPQAAATSPRLHRQGLIVFFLFSSFFFFYYLSTMPFSATEERSDAE